MKRHLAIQSEYLAPLTSDELTSVGGGAATLRGCLTGYYPSINAPCPTFEECDLSLPRVCVSDHCTGTTTR